MDTKMNKVTHELVKCIINNAVVIYNIMSTQESVWSERQEFLLKTSSMKLTACLHLVPSSTFTHTTSFWYGA